jgi:hypothetical protein
MKPYPVKKTNRITVQSAIKNTVVFMKQGLTVAVILLCSCYGSISQVRFGDNLGNHKATDSLRMQGHAILGASLINTDSLKVKIISDSLRVEGSTVRLTAIGNGGSSGDSLLVIDADGLVKRYNTSTAVGFDGTRAITRAGWTGVTGLKPSTATLIAFLNKVFYPVSSPMITSLNYNGQTSGTLYSYETQDVQKVVSDFPGTITIPYSTWVGGTFPFNYNVTNRSATDGGNSPIQTIELYNQSTLLGTNTIKALTLTLSGSFSLNKSNFITDIDNIKTNNSVTLKVTDASSNVVTLPLNITFNAAVGVTIASARIQAIATGTTVLTGVGNGTSNGSPYLVERTGADIYNYFVWSYTPNDDVNAITNVTFSGNGKPADLTGTNLTTTSAPITFTNATPATVYNIGVTAKGSVANDVSGTSSSAYYQLRDRMYCGFLASDVAPTSEEIKALPNSGLDVSGWNTDAGNTYTNTIGVGVSGYFAWAVPTYVDGALAAPTTTSIKPYFYTTGQWIQVTNINTYYVKVQIGSTYTWYWVCVYKASTGNGTPLKVKLS